ncbi:hypothetical protein COO91_00417 [Nostoc flagelliforme CCNUN1]|uniref:Uncharacterized protein n=1 Tax=Nostoc flagelliforme CCNUN1 TaxID=2038116 RepID=A0A2K8SGL7_9NOSO|nr:hypothetical protein COO91_00417 [Nostoc flagelliforme CCNUN1]
MDSTQKRYYIDAIALLSNKCPLAVEYLHRRVISMQTLAI